jgi:hypothetical protein
MMCGGGRVACRLLRVAITTMIAERSLIPSSLYKRLFADNSWRGYVLGEDG